MSEQPAHSEQSISVNGEPRTIPEGCTVEHLLSMLGMRGKRVAVAVDREVVPRSSYHDTLVGGGARVEILEAVGGG